ncbi:MAG: Npun_F0813 family protein [Cyanophyceae cyanobacterium]
MFILKRQDVEISNIRHPDKDQTIPILSYQGQTFTLLNVFSAAQAEEARSLWRDLTDNRGKACVLLEDPERYNVWGKVRLDKGGGGIEGGGADGATPGHPLGAILLMQAVYFDIEDLLGDRQAAKFRQDIGAVLNKLQLQGGESAAAVENVLTFDPFEGQVPVWGDLKIMSLLQELHGLGKVYFGNANFTGRALDALQDMDEGDRTELSKWLTQGPLAKLW